MLPCLDDIHKLPNRLLSRWVGVAASTSIEIAPEDASARKNPMSALVFTDGDTVKLRISIDP